MLIMVLSHYQKTKDMSLINQYVSNITSASISYGI